MDGLRILSETQPRVASVLSAALTSARLHHAYLLVGPEVAACDLMARAVARALVCERPEAGDACGACTACHKLESGNHPDVVMVGPNDKGVINIEQVRDTGARLSLRAAESRTKVVLLLRADAMTPQAQNALLKTLEEPVGPTCFLLTATRWRAMLPTIRSRSLTLRLAPDDRLRAHARLESAGVSPELARALGPLIGADQAKASELLELGADEIVTGLRKLLASGIGTRELLAAAADWGQTRERADLALALLELSMRDSLARRHGAGAQVLYESHETSCLDRASSRQLSAVVGRLQQLRRLSSFHVNRTLAIETAFAPLATSAGAAK